MFRLDAPGTTCILFFSQSLLCFEPSRKFFSLFFSSRTAEFPFPLKYTVPTHKAAPQSQGPYVSVFTMMSRWLLTLSESISKREVERNPYLCSVLLLSLNTNHAVPVWFIAVCWHNVNGVHKPLRFCLKTHFFIHQQAGFSGSVQSSSSTAAPTCEHTLRSDLHLRRSGLDRNEWTLKHRIIQKRSKSFYEALWTVTNYFHQPTTFVIVIHLLSSRFGLPNPEKDWLEFSFRSVMMQFEKSVFNLG